MKVKLLLSFALLLTAVIGAWAQNNGSCGDPDVNGGKNVVWASQYLEYEIALKNSAGNNTWRFADYHTANGASRFYYQMKRPSNATLTVNGQDADYTTSKFFIDEAAYETVSLDVVYSPEVSNPYAVEIYSNVGRRDFWNADIDHDGVADAIRPPSGDLVTADTEGSYFAAIPMEWDASAQVWKKKLEVGKTGAYRLTARYKETASDTWHYYSGLGSGLRDHAIVVSPKKVLEQRVYEVNGMTVKASSATEAGHSTFKDLIEGEDSYAEFGIPYLNKILANCLWFQPIHTSSEYGLAEGGEPGNPYLTKDLFSVSKWYGKSGTTAGALTEFQNFVAACDAGLSPSMSKSDVGTINIMLDANFNHTSCDAVFGVMGETLGIVPAGTGASTAIASVMPGWYANYSDYGEPATFYNGRGDHDIACAPDRGDFGKWEDTMELYYGRYSSLVRHNPDNNNDYLNEDDQYDYTSMSEETEKLWEYMGRTSRTGWRRPATTLTTTAWARWTIKASPTTTTASTGCGATSAKGCRRSSGSTASTARGPRNGTSCSWPNHATAARSATAQTGNSTSLKSPLPLPRATPGPRANCSTWSTKGYQSTMAAPSS